MKNTTMQHDSQGFEKPCRANNFRSNRPSAFQITLNNSTDEFLEILRARLFNEINLADTMKEGNRLWKELEKVEKTIEERAK